VSVKDFRAILESELESYQRNRSFAALLARESGLGSEGLTVVGGSALEIYTTGDYASDDIDLLVEHRDRVEEVLRSWGFRKKGMYWRHSKFPTIVQLVGRYDSGSRERNQVVSTDYGPLRLAAIEDIIWKRVIEARSWNRPEAFEEARLAVLRYADRIDWDYVERKGGENGVLDLIRDLRRTSGSGDEGPPKFTGR
jgi:hypothetical protein